MFRSIGRGLGLLSWAIAVTAVGASSPTFTDLGLLHTWDNGVTSNSVGWGINASGQVAGYGAIGNNRAFLYQGGSLVDITANGLDGKPCPTSQAFGINDAGTVVGVGTNSTLNGFRGFVTSGGSMTTIDGYDSTIGQSRAYSVNSSGTVVGQAYFTTNQWQAMIYSYSGTYNAATGVYGDGAWSYANINGELGGGSSNAMAINNAGTVVGTFNTTTALTYYSYPHAYVRTATGLATDLGVPAGMDSSWGTGVNANGDAVGYAYLQSTGSSGSAFLAVRGASGYAMNLLDMPNGCNASQALGVNKYDVVAGQAYNATAAGWRAYLWTTGGVPFYGLSVGVNDLNALAAAVLPAGWVLNTARSINDSGQIAGTGTCNGQSRAFILSLPQWLPGDANLDGKVDINDLNRVLTNYDKSGGVGWDAGDFNGDGKIDINDLNTVLKNYDRTAGPSASFSAVPEPSALTLSAIGLLGAAWLAAARRR